MLTELAMCNSAFQIIKKTIQNGREIFECGEAVSKFVSAKEELRERGTKRRNNIYHSLKGTNFGDLEEFMALEKVKKQEEELKEFMLLYGRPNLYTDFLKFCSKARKERKLEIAKRKKQREELIEAVAIGTLVVLIIMVVCFFGYIFITRS